MKPCRLRLPSARNNGSWSVTAKSLLSIYISHHLIKPLENQSTPPVCCCFSTTFFPAVAHYGVLGVHVAKCGKSICSFEATLEGHEQGGRVNYTKESFGAFPTQQGEFHDNTNSGNDSHIGSKNPMSSPTKVVHIAILHTGS